VFTQTARAFEATRDSPRYARRFVEDRLTSWGVSGGDPILLAVSELTTNAVTHGAGPITLTLSATDDLVRVQVEDGGAGKPIMRTPDPTVGVTSGWGLRVVERVADDWGVERGADTTCVWFESLRQADEH
jgi:anti-sigma regulatory factor (Ser/Thr protein kinase)